jgi:hypothetical protein
VNGALFAHSVKSFLKSRRRYGWIIGLVLFAPLILVAGGCAAKKKPAPAAAASTADSGQSNPTALVPQASIQVSYAHPRDYLKALTVTKYSGANILLTSPAGKNTTASIVRFEGGISIWQINVDKSVLANLPLLDFQREYALKKITYGVMPKHFIQTIPENGPPEPLEPDHYYVFEVTRGSGAPSWQAVKIGGDGSLTSYAAEPRAGTSYRLCCNVGVDFTVTGNSMEGNSAGAADSSGSFGIPP